MTLVNFMNTLAYYFVTFIIYAFLGWVCEVTLSIIEDKKFVNRGFLIGPLCPIYGFGAIFIITALGKYSDDPLVLFLLAVIGCAVLEYFTSYIMEVIFKNRWWDYSNMKYNINGRICLEYAGAFGVGGVIVTYITNPLLSKFIYSFDPFIINVIAIILLIIFIIDMTVSFNIIIKLKNISNSVRGDSTEIITKKVRETLKSQNIFLKRLMDSFPNMQIYNRLAILKQKLDEDKRKLKEEKKRRSRF